MFNHSTVNIETLKRRAYNFRWATVPDGVIPLTAADPDFPCAPEITEAISRFIKDRYLCYGPPEGLPDLKNAIAEYFQTKRKVMVEGQGVLPVDSAAFGIYLTCKTFLQKGDEAIIFDPVDFLFQYSVESVNATAITFPIPAGEASINFELLQSLITPRTKLLCICNPLNPTGKVFTKEELQKFGEIANKYDLIILSDEIWSDIVYEPAKYVSIASLDDEIKKRSVIVTGFSKSYGLAGLRVGAVIAPDPVLFDKLFSVSLHASTVHGTNILGQVAATAALKDCDYWLADFLKHLRLMRDLCVTKANAIKGFNCIAPEGTYVAFINISNTNRSNQEVSDLLLDKAKVAVVPGLPKWFGKGATGYIRMCFATSDVLLKEAFNRIERSIN